MSGGVLLSALPAQVTTAGLATVVAALRGLRRLGLREMPHLTAADASLLEDACPRRLHGPPLVVELLRTR
jgi:hypothetical protein